MSFRRIYSPFAFSARSIIILSAYLPFVDIFIVLHLSSGSLLPVHLLLNYYDITFFDKCQSSEPFVRYPFSPFLILECLQSINCSLNQIFQCPSKHIAPRSMTSLEHPAAKFLLLYFFFTDFNVQILYTFDGRINTTAPIRPVSSSTAYNTFSISCSGLISTVIA